MLKKSRVIAVLSVFVMMFGVVQPACAWDWGGSFVGGIAGAIVGGVAVVVTGGAALPFVVGGAVAGAAVGGADESPKTQALSGAAAGVGAAVMYDAWKNSPQQQTQPQYQPIP